MFSPHRISYEFKLQFIKLMPYQRSSIFHQHNLRLCQRL
jgi:hypothetical protein